MEEKHKEILVFLLMLEEECHQKTALRNVLIGAASHSLTWHDRIQPMIHTSCMLQGNPNFLFEHADDSIMEKVTYLNVEIFETIYSVFYPMWLCSLYGGSHSHRNRRVPAFRCKNRLFLYLVN